ncbi:TPA: hypothetical protein HA351_12230 [Methanosarcinaceae archaeon]|nr:hypothetical protein [Methanosarcinaceae archaeon]
MLSNQLDRRSCRLTAGITGGNFEGKTSDAGSTAGAESPKNVGEFPHLSAASGDGRPGIKLPLVSHQSSRIE